MLSLVNEDKIYLLQVIISMCIFANVITNIISAPADNYDYEFWSTQMHNSMSYIIFHIIFLFICNLKFTLSGIIMKIILQIFLVFHLFIINATINTSEHLQKFKILFQLQEIRDFPDL